MTVSETCEVFDTHGDIVIWNSFDELTDILRGKQILPLLSFASDGVEPKIIKIYIKADE